ncbi:MAG: hypothetical protein OCD76_22225 [Reichenbachiella sp.]
MESKSEGQIKFEDVIRKGINRAVVAFSEMIEVSDLGKLEINFGDITLPEYEKNTLLHAYKTDLIGEIGGVSYLFFTREEVEKMAILGIEEEVFEENEEENRFLIQGFMEEIVNVLCASTLTEFVISFGIDIYGNVPKLYEGEASLVKERIKDELSDMNFNKGFKVELKNVELELDVEFVWIFHMDSMDKLLKAAEKIKKVA